MIAAGRWVAREAVHWPRRISSVDRLLAVPKRELAEHRTEFLAAHKDPILLRTFTNTTLGQVFEERGTGRPVGRASGPRASVRL